MNQLLRTLKGRVPGSRGLFLFALFIGLLPAIAWGQTTVTGTVLDETGEPLLGATVIVEGTTTGAFTDEDGKFSIQAEVGSTLRVTMASFQPAAVPVTENSRDLVITLLTSTLDEILVTGYTAERKADIIGSVSVVNTDDMLTTPAANLESQLQGRASGVVVSGNGQPGAGATVRIRGFTSFGNASPLYVIDGVPTRDASKINPQDIESIQVLKDATAASIYGARAAQGVIIITTKRGEAGPVKLTYNGYVGGQYIPQSVMPDLLNTNDYLSYLKQANTPDVNHPVFGTLGSATVPDFIVVSSGLRGGFNAGAPEVDPSLYTIEDYGNIYQILETSQPGTNWFDEITRTGIMHSHQLSANGGSDKGTYSMGLNYFDQEGAFIHTGYRRIAARVNTQLTPTKWFRVGENMQVINENFLGGANRGEASGWAQSFRMVPYIPVYDINGGWGGNGVGESGNGTSPVAQLYRGKDNKSENYKIFGNAYAELEPVKGLVFRTSFGIDYGNFYNKSIVYRTYERSENVSITGLNQSQTWSLFWTWTNTASYTLNLGTSTLKFLAGTEAIKGTGDGIVVGTNTFDFEDPDFVSLNTDQQVSPAVSSTNFRQTLASVFGRIDYTFNNKYLLNATVRRDGSSKFGSDNLYGVFPAFGAGWRVSEEGFMKGITAINDLKIRGGWGQMGSEQNVDPLNQYSIFYFNVGATNYDIGRTQNSLAQGFAAQRVGSSATKWETSETTNIGFDLSMFNYKWDISFNYFINNTKDLLVPRIRNGLEPLVIQPAVNIGQMQNRGFDFNVTNRGTIGSEINYDLTLTFTHYQNTVQDIDGNPESFFSVNASRLNNVARTQAGYPIASFWGYEIDGFFETQEDLNALSQDGAVIGSWRYKDQNNDGVINDEDQTIIGNPHPDFVMGINLGMTYRNWDFSTFWVLNYGNDLYNYTKYFTDMRVFVGGVSQRVLNNSWTAPGDANAVLPKLAPGTENGYTSFTTSTSNDYYVEDGSFFRARTIQLGYSLPNSALNAINMRGVRLYLQGSNLITITRYGAAEPDINVQNINGNDLSMGIDETGYPLARQVLLGLDINF